MTWLLKHGSVALALLLLVSACGVDLIAPYNQTVVDGVVQTNSDVDGILTSVERGIGTDDAVYENYVEQYDQLHIDIRALILQVECIPRGDITVTQIELLDEMISVIEETHQAGEFNSTGDIVFYRDHFFSSCKQIIELELFKLMERE